MPLDFTKPIQTRDGRKVRILATDLIGNHTIAAAVTKFDGTEELVDYAPDGRFFPESNAGYDLVNLPEKRTVWLSYYGGDDFRVFDTKEHADCHQLLYGCRHRIACIPVEIEIPATHPTA